MRLQLIRTEQNDKQTLGELVETFWTGIRAAPRKVHCRTLELTWKDNQVDVSCIPDGIYKVTKYRSSTHGWCFKVWDVPGRTLIRIHAGNFYDDITGCILVGKKHSDINGDGYRDVTKSGDTMDMLWRLLPDEWELEIISDFPHFEIEE